MLNFIQLNSSSSQSHILIILSCERLYQIEMLFGCSCLENPRDGGAWWAAVYGRHESDTTEVTAAAAPYHKRRIWEKVSKLCTFLLSHQRFKLFSFSNHFLCPHRRILPNFSHRLPVQDFDVSESLENLQIEVLVCWFSIFFEAKLWVVQGRFCSDLEYVVICSITFKGYDN